MSRFLSEGHNDQENSFTAANFAPLVTAAHLFDIALI